MEFQWCHPMQLPLDSSVVVVVNVAAYGFNKLCPTRKLPAVVCLPFQNSPEPFHRAVVDAVGDTGHAMNAAMHLHNGPKLCACVLESTIAVAKRMGIRFSLKRLSEGLHHKRVIIAVTYPVCDYAPVVEVKDCAKVDLDMLPSSRTEKNKTT